MRSTIYTIGFTQKTAEEFFRLLQEAGVRKLIDVRENRAGQLAGFAKFPDLVLEPGRTRGGKHLTVGRFTFGCSGRLASAFRAELTARAGFEFQFKGEELGRAAVERLVRVVEQLERLSARPRSEAAAFAIHEPNPRLTRIFAENAHVPPGKIAWVSRAFGNLGSATCGVGLCAALRRLANAPGTGRPLIFVAAVGPGLLWGGTYLH